MKPILLAGALALATLPAFAQTAKQSATRPAPRPAARPEPAAAVGFTKLMEYLPAQPPAGFAAAKPSGNAQKAGGVASSHAEIVFRQTDGGTPPLKTIRVGITDEGAAAAGVPDLAVESESQTETGYEKTFPYKGFICTEKTETSPGFESCSLTLRVARRFVVEFSGEHFSDLGVLTNLLEGMKIEALAAETGSK